MASPIRTESDTSVILCANQRGLHSLSADCGHHLSYNFKSQKRAKNRGTEGRVDVIGDQLAGAIAFSCVNSIIGHA